MNCTNMKIVTDSSADVLTLEDIPFASAPLKIITAQKEYVDDAALDVPRMVNELSSYSDKSSTSCPSVGDWLTAFGDAESVFCVTVTSGLSGSYNSAEAAKRQYEELRIGHCFNEQAVAKIKDMIRADFKNAEIESYALRGLCSFYAERGGILIGFEKE